MKNKININSKINNRLIMKKNIENIQKKPLTKKSKFSYSLPKNIIINILSIFCKFKKKDCFNVQHLIKKKKKFSNNTKKILNNEKKHSRKRLLFKINIKNNKTIKNIQNVNKVFKKKYKN